MDVHEGDHIDLGDQHLIVHTAAWPTRRQSVHRRVVLHEGATDLSRIWAAVASGAGPSGAEQRLKNAES